MSTRENPENRIPLLKIQSLCKNFPSNSLLGESARVLDNVDLCINPGEVRGIVGESGAGKTTLARCSLRLIEPSSGSIYFNGQDLTVLDPASLRVKRREFQMIFQDAYASMNPTMTVEQILSEPFQVHGVGDRDLRHQRISELLEAVSLDESLLDRRPGELSGGQQQRVGIARGLVLKPKLVVADEPVSALDASVQAQILNLLADLKRKFELTLILISHSLSAIHYLCNHISVLYRGRVIEEAPAEAFFTEPKHPYSKTLLDATLTFDPLKRFHPKPSGPSIAASARIQSGCAYHPYCSYRLPVCVQKVPQLIEIKSSHRAACFLFLRESE